MAKYSCRDCEHDSLKTGRRCGVIWNHWTCCAEECPKFELIDYKEELRKLKEKHNIK